MNRVQKQFQQRQQQQGNHTAARGKTSIDSNSQKNPTSNPNSKKTVGEYVDYEEID